MGVPAQGNGSSTPWSPDGGWEGFPWDLPNEGTPWNFVRLIALLAKTINNLGWLKNHSAFTDSSNNFSGSPQLFDDITATNGSSYKVSSRVETRLEAVTWTPVAAAGFALNADGSATDAATGNDLVAHVPIPHGCTLNAVYVSINPTNGHAGLPATKPTFTMTSQVDTTNTFTTIATGTDASANAAAYDAIHYVSATGLSVTINRSTTIYTIRLLGEFGANALAGLVVYGAVKLVYTRSTVGED